MVGLRNRNGMNIVILLCIILLDDIERSDNVTVFIVIYGR